MRKILPTIVIVGDSSGTALVAPIAEALTNEDLQVRDILGTPRIQPTVKSGELVETTKWEEGTLVYGFPGVHRASNDRYSFDVLTSILSGPGGRFESVREQEGTAFTVESSSVMNAKGGAVFSYATFPPGKESDIRATLDAEHAKLRQNSVSADELRRAVSYAIGSRDASLQTRESRVLEYARAIYSGAGVPAVAGYPTAMRAVTLPQLNSVIERYMQPAALRLGITKRAQ